MDTIAKRFPHLAVNISNNLDDQSLVKFKEANREISEFMIQNQFYWIRILKKYNDYFETSNESWKKSISNTPIEFVRKLAMATLNFFKTVPRDLTGAGAVPTRANCSHCTRLLFLCHLLVDSDMLCFLQSMIGWLGSPDPDCG